MIGENDVFSCVRSISLVTIIRLLWATASVIGSIGRASAAAVKGLFTRSFPVSACDADDQIAERVDTRAIAGIENSRRVELLDDRRSGDFIARDERFAREHRRVVPFTIEIDGARCGGRERRHSRLFRWQCKL